MRLLSRFEKMPSVGRIWKGIERRLRQWPGSVQWQLGWGQAVAHRKGLAEYRDRYRGECCVVLANGPSLARVSFDSLEGTKSFGTNRIYLAQRSNGFVPTFYTATNEFVIAQYARDIGRLPTTKFLPWDSRRHFGPGDDRIRYVHLRLSLNDEFGLDPVAGFASGGTVTFFALQLAYYMGFTEVILLGLDHRYETPGEPNRVVVQERERDSDHFHPNYFPTGHLFQLPDLHRSEIAYRLAREAFERDGRRIVDATPGGACEVFEKVPLDKTPFAASDELSPVE